MTELLNQTLSDMLVHGIFHLFWLSSQPHFSPSYFANFSLKFIGLGLVPSHSTGVGTTDPALYPNNSQVIRISQLHLFYFYGICVQ